MIKRIFISLALLLLSLIGLMFWRGEHMALAYIKAQTQMQDYETLYNLLQPEMILRLPEEANSKSGPFPLFIQLHGCGGMSLDQHGSYAQLANEAGYAALIVSSNAPRGYDRDRSRAEICQGKALLGQERAADILIALDYASTRPEIDVRRITLAGWSHGAWTIMDYLSLEKEARLPAGLAGYQGPRPEIQAAVLFYPYCGRGTRTRLYGWGQSPAVITFMGTGDSVVDYTQCEKNFMQLANHQGVEIEKHLYEGAEHAFDHAHLPARIAHWYDADKSTDARAKLAAFLRDGAVGP